MSWALEREGEVVFVAILDIPSDPTPLTFLSVHTFALYLVYTCI